MCRIITPRGCGVVVDIGKYPWRQLERATTACQHDLCRAIVRALNRMEHNPSSGTVLNSFWLPRNTSNHGLYASLALTTSGELFIACIKFWWESGGYRSPGGFLVHNACFKYPAACEGSSSNLFHFVSRFAFPSSHSVGGILSRLCRCIHCT